ncbi:glyoxylate/hydroxypyruvate reductase A, partial [Caulobacter segnis]
AIRFGFGAGVDRILQDPDLPDVPIARMRDEGLTQGMVEFVLARTLHYHRLMPAYEEQQRQRVWRPLIAPLARDRTVGVLGLGQLGAACATNLAANGFKVRGWSRTPKDLPGVEAFDGPLETFLAPCEVVVCLLPLTPATRGILNAGTLSHLSGASLISVGRGAHLVEADLIPALDAGHLAHATLDVFAIEPLPAAHPFWSDPRITVTPHASALTPPQTAGPTIVANIRRHLAGQDLQDLVDRAAGY